MRKVALSLLVPLLAAACGSSPISPTPAATAGSPAAPGVSLAIRLAPDSDPTTGWRSPTSVSLQAFDRAASAIIESATFRMLDDQGQVLAQATAAMGDNLPADAYLSGNTVVQTLTWPLEKGYGKRIDGSLTLRNAAGEVRTVPLSIPAR